MLNWKEAVTHTAAIKFTKYLNEKDNYYQTAFQYQNIVRLQDSYVTFRLGATENIRREGIGVLVTYSMDSTLRSIYESFDKAYWHIRRMEKETYACVA